MENGIRSKDQNKGMGGIGIYANYIFNNNAAFLSRPTRANKNNSRIL